MGLASDWVADFGILVHSGKSSSFVRGQGWSNCATKEENKLIEVQCSGLKSRKPVLVSPTFLSFMSSCDHVYAKAFRSEVPQAFQAFSSEQACWFTKLVSNLNECPSHWKQSTCGCEVSKWGFLATLTQEIVVGKNRGKPPNLEFFLSCPVGVLTGWDIFIILSLFVKALVRTKFYVLLVGPRSSISLQVLPVPPEDRGWQYGASPENRIAEKRIQIHHLCHMAEEPTFDKFLLEQCPFRYRELACSAVRLGMASMLCPRWIVMIWTTSQGTGTERRRKGREADCILQTFFLIKHENSTAEERISFRGHSQLYCVLLLIYYVNV